MKFRLGWVGRMTHREALSGCWVDELISGWAEVWSTLQAKWNVLAKMESEDGMKLAPHAPDIISTHSTAGWISILLPDFKQQFELLQGTQEAWKLKLQENQFTCSSKKNLVPLSVVSTVYRFWEFPALFAEDFGVCNSTQQLSYDGVHPMALPMSSFFYV